MGIENINYIELSNCIVDELHVRQRTDSEIDLTEEKQEWQLDTYLLARFFNDLEAGNINMEGIAIEKFVIKRRSIDELNSIILGYVDYEHGELYEYLDYTQPNDRFIYSITPIATGDIEGKPTSVEIESDFVGFYIVDKDINNVLKFDKVIGNDIANVEKTLNQGRIQIETFNKYPSIYYTEQEYTSFSLSAVFIPSEWERSGKMYDRILNNFIRQHKSFIVKGSDGSIYVADISNPRKTTIMNSSKGFDYIQLIIDCVEVQDYKEFMQK